MLWEDKLPAELARHQTQFERIPIVNLQRGTRILTGGGRVGVLTGYKTNMNVQVKLVDDSSFQWISKLAKVDLA